MHSRSVHALCCWAETAKAAIRNDKVNIMRYISARRATCIESMPICLMATSRSSRLYRICTYAWATCTLTSSRALARSAVAASRLSLFSSMVRGMRKPVKSGTLVPSENDVLPVFWFEYVFSDVRPRPNDQFCDADALRLGSRLFLAVVYAFAQRPRPMLLGRDGQGSH